MVEKIRYGQCDVANAFLISQFVKLFLLFNWSIKRFKAFVARLLLLVFIGRIQILYLRLP